MAYGALSGGPNNYGTPIDGIHLVDGGEVKSCGLNESGACLHLRQ